MASCDRVYDHYCDTRRSIVDQSWGATIDRTINRGIVRPIVATYDRSYDQSYSNRGTKRPIIRSIVASCDRSYDQSCGDYRSAIIHNWWCHHTRLVVRSCKTYLRSYDLESQVRCFEHDHRPCYDSFCPDGHPRPLRPIVRSFYDLPTIIPFSVAGRS